MVSKNFSDSLVLCYMVMEMADFIQSANHNDIYHQETISPIIYLSFFANVIVLLFTLFLFIADSFTLSRKSMVICFLQAVTNTRTMYVIYITSVYHLLFNLLYYLILEESTKPHKAPKV